jgi:ABC-type Na+ transport system ATPase subunit NatA
VNPAEGYSSGEVQKVIAEVAEQTLPLGYGYEYGGMAREEANTGGAQTVFIYAICIFLIYLILACLYESFLIPFAVIFSVPFGLMGSFLFAKVLGLENNIYLQTGVIMLIGLLAKTAILITEYAIERRRKGMGIVESAYSAAQVRLRPILMTVLTMIFGMLPLMFSSGAGANGAGKTTFIKMLLGLYPIDGGELTLLGKAIQTQEDRQALKASIGYVSQHFALYNDMSVEENLLYAASMRGISMEVAKSRIGRYAVELGFDEYLTAMPQELPLGINQRFSLASALLHEPVILFLDEPTSGVDAIARAKFWELLKALKERWEISILITTHYMSEAEFCDRVVLLKQGKKIADHTLDEFYAKHPQAHSFEEIFLEYYR